MAFRFFLALCLAISIPAAAQDGYSTGSCAPSVAETVLETGNIRARVFNDGALFWKGGQNIYEAPKGSGIQSLFSANLWLTGFVDGELRVAGSTYGPYEFWSGPLPEDGSAPSDCAAFDRIWEIHRDQEFWPEDQPPVLSPAIIEWPVHLGAPFVDRNGQPGYQPHEGDYPAVQGDHFLWWVMNDRGNVHSRSRTGSLGVEVRASAFGFDAESSLGSVTFYRYHLLNRGPSTIHEMHAGFYADVELGWFADDRLGTDTTLAMLYGYNASNVDGRRPSDDGYGESPPAIGITILEARNEAGTLPSDQNAPPVRHMTVSRSLFGGGGPMGDPEYGPDFHNFLSGFWKDGQPMTENLFGTEPDSPFMPFWMPGDPVSGSFWSEVNIDGRGRQADASDRKAALGFGPFDLAPGEWAQFTFAIIWARGSSNLDSITELRRVAADLHASRDNLLAPRHLKPALFEDGNPPESPQFPFWVDEPYPNPASDRLTLRASFDKSGPATIRIVDVLGRTLIEETHHVDAAGLQDITLDVSSLPAGPYSVTVESWSHRASQSFVVMR